MSTRNEARRATPARLREPPRHVFFLWAHAAILVAVLIGFSQSLYLGPLFSDRPLAPVLVVHGLVLTGWFVFALGQSLLIRWLQTRLHRRLGYFGAGYAGLVLASAVVADWRLGRQITSPSDPENIVVWANLFTLVVFAGCVTLAVASRKNADVHRRLILLASISIAGPALARFSNYPVFPGGLAARPAYGIGGLLVLCASVLVYDVMARGRIHPASGIGVLALVAGLAAGVALGVSGLGFQWLQWI